MREHQGKGTGVRAFLSLVGRVGCLAERVGSCCHLDSPSFSTGVGVGVFYCLLSFRFSLPECIWIGSFHLIMAALATVLVPSPRKRK